MHTRLGVWDSGMLNNDVFSQYIQAFRHRPSYGDFWLALILPNPRSAQEVVGRWFEALKIVYQDVVPAGREVNAPTINISIRSGIRCFRSSSHGELDLPVIDRVDPEVGTIMNRQRTQPWRKAVGDYIGRPIH
jgi:hypothetical protein